MSDDKMTIRTGVEVDPVERLERLSRLHDQGKLTDGEFSAAKREAGISGNSDFGRIFFVCAGTLLFAAFLVSFK